MLGGLVLALGILAPAAQADERVTQTGTSPARAVVAHLPGAVSVTFSGPIREDGAELIVTGPSGDATDGRTEVVGNALRQELADDLPGGKYEVTWTVESQDDDVLGGRFSFTAARGNGTAPAPTPTAAPSATPAPAWPAAGPASPADPPRGGLLPPGLIVVPLLMAAVLVLASAVVGLARAHRRNPARPTVTLSALLHRGAPLP